jgi:hypothetical protein
MKRRYSTPGERGPADGLAGLFRRAALYRSTAGAAAPVVREGEGRGRRFPFSERHVQCVWFDPRLRPPALRTLEGEAVLVEDPGTWNLESGPDFIGAALRIGPERRRVTGDVEVHVSPDDWRSHKHRDDPAYARVRVHVTYFPGRLPPGELPPGALQIALRDLLAENPCFSFENIDVSAYPYAARSDAPPCGCRLRGWSADEKGAVLDAAGEERLRRKAERMAGQIAEKGEDQAIYEEVMAALGYQQNKAPFRRLAELVCVEDLRAESGGCAEAGYALLLGVSGLLPAKIDAGWDGETREFLRSLWDAWWKFKERWGERVMAPGDWRLTGLRPANHPVRRLMAAALWFSRPDGLLKPWRSIGESGAANSLERARACVLGASHPYWDRRLGVGLKKSLARTALVGRDRAEAIVLNTFIPYAAAAGLDIGGALVTEALPSEGVNWILRQTAHNLLGRDHNPTLYRSGLRRQGLLQIFHDYCLNDRSRCASCPFPGWLDAQRPRFGRLP